LLTLFVEFVEHEHALKALRCLNNSSKPFGPERRLHVDFAVENALELRQRKLRNTMMEKRTLKQQQQQSQKRKNDGDADETAAPKQQKKQRTEFENVLRDGQLAEKKLTKRVNKQQQRKRQQEEEEKFDDLVESYKRKMLDTKN